MNHATNKPNPYAAPKAAVDDIRESGEAELAGRGTRLVATMLDGVILLILFWGLRSILTLGSIVAMAQFARWQAKNPFQSGLAMAALTFLVFTAVNSYLLHKNGQTVGKRLLNIKIVRSNGEKADLMRVLFLRYLPGSIAGMIPVVNFLYSLIDALLIFRGSRKCLHDNIADTIVVKV